MKSIIILILSFSIQAFAESLVSGSDTSVEARRVRAANEGDNKAGLTQGTSSSSTSQSTQVGDDGQNLSATGGFQGTSSGGLQNANQAQSSGGMTQILGLAMGAGFARICPTLHGAWACAPAAMSFMDALAAGRAKNNAAYTGAFLDPTTGLPTFDANNMENQQAIDGLSTLQSMGYSFNEDGSVNTPTGEKVTTADVGSVQALMNKGMTAEQARSAMSQMQGVQMAAAEKAGLDPELVSGAQVAALAKGSSGGETSFATPASGDIIIEEIEYRGSGKGKDDRMPASKAAELSKNFNGTPIGIGMANLFLIVHKKYTEKKDKQTEFINREY